jgi:hypothetical protein
MRSKLKILIFCAKVLTDRSSLLTQIFSSDCRDALGQMLEAQVLSHQYCINTTLVSDPHSFCADLDPVLFRTERGFQ